MDNFKDRDPQPLQQANDDYNDNDWNNFIQDKDTEPHTRLRTKQVDTRRWKKNDSQQRTTTGTATTETTTIDHNRTITQKIGRKSSPFERRVFNRKCFKYRRRDDATTLKNQVTTTRKQPIIKKIIRKHNCNINLVKCNNETNAPPPSSSSTTSTTTTQRKGKVLRKVFDLSKYRYVKKN